MTQPVDIGIRMSILENEVRRDVGEVRAEFQRLNTQVKTGGATATAASRDYDKLSASVLRTANDAGRLDMALQRQHQHAGLLSGSLSRLVSGYVAFQAAQAGFNAVATRQDAQDAFAGLLGSQREAIALTRELEGLKSPFGTGGLFGDAQSLLTFGASAASVVPTIRALSDAVAGTGPATSARLTASSQAFAQLRQETFLTTSSLSQLQSQGLPAADILAKAHGMSTFTLNRALSSGALRISGQQAADELLAGFDARYKGQSDKASQSIRGSLTRLGNDASKALAQGLGPELPQLTAFVNTLGQELPGIAHVAGVALKPFGEILGLMAAHPHLTEALGGFLLLRTAVGPALELARATREIAAGMALIGAAQGGGGLARSLGLATLGLNGGIRTAGGAAVAETAAAQALSTAELSGWLGSAGATPAQRAGVMARMRAARAGGTFGRVGGRAAVMGGTAALGLGATFGGQYLQGKAHGGFGHGAAVVGTDAATGALLGAELGSIIPGAGTALGAGIGAAAGGLWGLGHELWKSHHDASNVDVGGVHVSIGSATTPDEIRNQAIAALSSPAAMAQFQAAIDNDRLQTAARKRIPVP